LPGFWHSAFFRAVRDSFGVFETSPKLIGLCVLGAIVTALLVFVIRGKKAFAEHLIANIAIAFGGAILTWLLVFIAVLVHLPAKMLTEANDNLTKVIEEKQQFSVKINEQEEQLRKDESGVGSTSTPHSMMREPKSSLRRRTLQLVNDLEAFQKERNYKRMQVPTTRDASGKAQDLLHFDSETLSLFVSSGLKERTNGILLELQAKGLPLGMLQYIIQNGPLYSDNELEHLRDLAYRLDAYGNLVRF